MRLVDRLGGSNQDFQMPVANVFGARSQPSLRNSAVFKEHRASLRCGGGNGMSKSSSSGWSSASRAMLSNVLPHSGDSGFSSAPSSGGSSCCSFLPPPPPYRANRGGPGKAAQHRIHRSLSDSKYGSSSSGGGAAAYQFLKRPMTAAAINPHEMWYRVQRANSCTTTSRSPSPSMSTVSCPEYPELQEKLHRLAMARDSLSLQVTILTEQVGAQKDKIRDLECLLTSKASKLDSTEELLQERVENRGDLESRKLDLLAEVSNLKLKYATLEQEKIETERKLQLSQAEIEHLNQTMQSFVMQHGMHAQVYNPQMHTHLSYNQPIIAEALPMENDPAAEMEQLRLAVQRLIMDNEQKNIQINSLRSALDEHCRNGREDPCPATAVVPAARYIAQNNYEQTQPFDINTQLRRLLLDDVNNQIAHSSSFPNSLCNAQQRTTAISSRTASAVQSSSSYTSSLSAASPQHSWSNSGTPRHRVSYEFANSITPPVVPKTTTHASISYRSPSSPAARQLAAELDELRRIGNEIQQKHDSLAATNFTRPFGCAKAASTLTLPRKKLSLSSSGGISETSFFPSVDHTSFGMKCDKLLEDTTPNHACNVGFSAESDDEIMRGVQTRSSIEINKFKRGKTRSSFKNLLGKLTRSASQEIRTVGPFCGVGPRSMTSRIPISCSAPSCAVTIRPTLRQFAEWNKDQLCNWMIEVGFSAYLPEFEKSMRNGKHLLNMTNQEFEKELCITNPLHRKRLRCLLSGIKRGTMDAADRMDCHQVLLWLDDIGIPQYRDAMAENMINGQILTFLTAQDLIEMKITSALHHATIARGIQFLRSVGFCAKRLEKRFNPDLINKGPCPSEVERWSHHCVCEWLKAIDLAEFTPNLLCAGIHGALMLHEPTFTAETLAEVLQMPAHKTLLRRHLATHFNQLLGQEVVSHKRSVLAQPFVVQMSPVLKIRLLKKGFLSSRKKGKNEVYVEPDEPVCPPMDSKTVCRKQITESILDSLESSNV